MILQVVADRKIQMHGNSQLREVLLRTYAGQHQYPRRLYGAGREDDFVAGFHLEFVSVLRDFHAGRSAVFNCYLHSEPHLSRPHSCNTAIFCCTVLQLCEAPQYNNRVQLFYKTLQKCCRFISILC